MTCLIHQAMALPNGFSTTLSNPISIRLVLLGLVVMPTTELVLPFDVDGHRITPTTPTPDPAQATPISAKRFPVPPLRLLLRPAEQVAPELICCLLVKRQANGELLRGVVVETEAYSQEDHACHGYRRRTPSNETLFGEHGCWSPSKRCQ